MITKYNVNDIMRMVSDLSSEIELDKSEIARLRAASKKSSIINNTVSGISLLSSKSTVWSVTGTAGSGTTDATVDFSPYVPAGTKKAWCEVHMDCQSTTSLDGYLGLDWTPDGLGYAITLRYMRDQHVLADNCEIDSTESMAIPLTSSLKGTITYTQAQVATWAYSIKVWGYE